MADPVVGPGPDPDVFAKMLAALSKIEAGMSALPNAVSQQVEQDSANAQLASGVSVGGVVGQQTTLEQLVAQMAAIAGTVQTLTSQSGQTSAMQADMQKTLQSLTEVVNKQVNSNAISNESDSGYVGRDQWLHSSGDDLMRGFSQRDQIFTVQMQNLSNMVTNADALMKEYLKYDAGVWTRSLDHFGALPPIAPRSPTGPGVIAG